MTQSLRKVFYLGLVFIVGAAFIFPAMGQTINVTFRANLATNQDTITAGNGFVEMRGAYNGTAPGTLPDGNVIDWSSTSTLELTTDGGDYWSFTCQLNAGDTLVYKFWTGFDENAGTHPDNGWEGPFENQIGIDTRWFIAGTADTVLPLQYYHPAGHGTVNQFWRPFEEKTDTVAVYFRVNMAAQEQLNNFDPNITDTVGVRGNDVTSGGALDWGQTKVLLTREDGSALDSSFWSGAAYIPRDSVSVGTQQAYKFVFENDGTVSWEGTIGDRMFSYTNNLANNTMDTTLSWVWFDDVPYDPNLIPPVTADLVFRVSTEAMEGLELFDRGVGDAIYVIGPNGWDLPNPPYPPTGTGDLIELNFNAPLQEWTAVESFTRVPGTDINYKFFVRWDSSRVNPGSPNYIPNLRIRYLNHNDEDSGWEEPSITGGGNRVHTWTSDPTQFPTGDFGFDRQFFNAAPANCWYDHSIAITWSVNMQPASDPAHNTNPHLFTPASDSVWVQFDGSLFALSQGWPTFGHRAVLLTDPDADWIYTGTYNVNPPGWYQLGFLISYGNSTDGYVTNGGGTTSGRRYYQFVRPDSLVDEGGQFLTSYWPTSYNLNQIDWVQSNLPFEPPPDMTTPVAIDDEGNAIPGKFALHQNYPNPFNPSTTIRYELAQTSRVNITIYNVRGQKVKTLIDARQSLGKHTIEWDGRNDAYNPVASGVYFVKMKAGDFNMTRKMILIK